MNIGGVLVGGSGLWMMYCSVKNRNPLTALKDILTTGKISDSSTISGGSGGAGGSGAVAPDSGKQAVLNPDGTVKKNAPAILGGLATGGQVGAAIGGLVGLEDAGRIVGQLDGATVGYIFGDNGLLFGN